MAKTKYRHSGQAKRAHQNGGTTDATQLDNLINKGADALRKLHRLESGPGARKLTADSFEAEALKIANVTPERIDEIEKLLETAHGADSIRAFIRRLGKELSTQNYVRPFPDPSKACRIFGHSNLDGQAGQHGIKAGELQVLAVRACRTRFGDDVFGEVKDLTKHERKVEALREKLDGIYAEMRSAFSGDDVVIDASAESLLPNERARGLARVTFRRAPGLTPAHSDWPQKLIADCEAPVPRPRPSLESVAA